MAQNTLSKRAAIHNKKAKFKCQSCGRQFIDNPTQKVINSETIDLIEKLLLEKISLAGIARVTNVSQKWLQDYVNHKYEKTPRTVQVTPKNRGKLTIQCDEMWSFVGNKQSKIWIWLAIDSNTREIVGVDQARSASPVRGAQSQ